MLEISDKTIETIAMLSRRYPELLSCFAEFHKSLVTFCTRHLRTMAVGDLVDGTSFEVNFSGSTLRILLKTALRDADPVGLIAAYEARAKDQEDHKIDTLIFNRQGMSELTVRGETTVDVAYMAGEVVLDFFHTLFVRRLQS
jgi:hypothetical protein